MLAVVKLLHTVTAHASLVFLGSKCSRVLLYEGNVALSAGTIRFFLGFTRMRVLCRQTQCNKGILLTKCQLHLNPVHMSALTLHIFEMNR